jgi:hypothetical protein
LAGATITTIWHPGGGDELQVIVTPISEFIAQSPEGACSQSIFEESLAASDVKIHNGLAQVWAHYNARFWSNGQY